MLKSIFWAAVGAGAVLGADKWFQARKQKYSPSALTGRLLDTVNTRLEHGGSRPGGEF